MTSVKIWRLNIARSAVSRSLAENINKGRHHVQNNSVNSGRSRFWIGCGGIWFSL